MDTVQYSRLQETTVDYTHRCQKSSLSTELKYEYEVSLCSSVVPTVEWGGAQIVPSCAACSQYETRSHVHVQERFGPSPGAR
jgi:hypothetical protein